MFAANGTQRLDAAMSEERTVLLFLMLKILSSMIIKHLLFQINPLKSSAFMFASVEAFECGNVVRYLETKLNPTVYPNHLGKLPAPKNHSLWS